MGKILTSHVGSLPRTQEVVDFIFAREKGKEFAQAAFDDCMTRSVSETVRRQKEVGVDIVSDGETSKISYATYVKDRYTGFDGDSPRNAPADLKKFPSFLERLANDGGTPTYSRPMCVGEVKSKGQGELEKDIKNLKAAMAQHGVKRGFMNAASPGVISLFLQNDYYKTREQYLEALAYAMKDEYEEITSNGLKLQLDCPDLALARHMTFKDLSEEEFLIRAEKQIECLNNAIKNIDSSSIRLHICWGNYEGPHLHDIPLEKIMPIALKANVQTYLIESSNPRHSHEWQIFQNLKIPKDKIIAPGVIDSTTNFVEHPEVVKNRILTFSKVIDAEQLLAGTDCGFSTFAGFGNVDENIVYKKLESLVLGAELASKVI
jgi:5-methyltetrahydropteroyltriglutamate--homocysteine methyltransferase